MDIPETQSTNHTPAPITPPSESTIGGSVFHPHTPVSQTPNTPAPVTDSPAGTTESEIIKNNQNPVDNPLSDVNNTSPQVLSTKIVQKVISQPVQNVQKSLPTPPQIAPNISPKLATTSSNNIQGVYTGSETKEQIGHQTRNSSDQDNKFKFTMAVIVSIVLVIVGIGGLIFFVNKNTGQSAQWFGGATKKQANQNVGDGDGEQINNLPVGYKTVNRPCFKVGVPENAQVSEQSGCLLLVSSPMPQYLNFSVTPNTEKNAGLSALSAVAEKGYDAKFLKYVSTSDMTLGGSAAKKLSFTTVDSSVNQIKVLVVPPKPSYAQDGTPITSFVIGYSYKNEEEKTRAESSLLTWIWQ